MARGGFGSLASDARALSRGADDMRSGMDTLGLGPDQWDLDYQPLQPTLRDHSEAYSKGWRGLVERVAPVLGDAFSEADWQSPMARMAARLARSYGDHVQSGIDDRTADIDAENKRRMGVADEQNTMRRSQVTQNRASWLQAVKERAPLPREVLQRKLDQKAAEAAASATAGEQARINVRRDNGLNPTGTPTTPKSGKPPKAYDPQSFKLFGDADKVQIDEIEGRIKDAETELRGMKSNFLLRQAFEPVRQVGGKPGKEPPNITAARMRKADLDLEISTAKKEKRDAAKRALLWHAGNLPRDASQAMGIYTQLERSAESLGLGKDPEVDAALEAAAAALEKMGAN